MLLFFFRVLEIISPDLYLIRKIFTSAFFFLIGIVLYHGKLLTLRSVLIGFLALNIPIMICQILGIHESVMYWVTDFAHDESILALDEIGTFKDLPLYSTFLVPLENITYSIGQGRPAGLFPNNNILSVLIALTSVINLYVRPQRSSHISDLIVCIAVVLVMSKLVFCVAFFAFTLAQFSSDIRARLVGKRSIILCLCFIVLYYLCFPGLFSSNFSDAMIIVSFGLRFIDLFNSLGVDPSFFISHELSALYALNLEGREDGVSNGFALLFSSKYSIIATVFFMVLFYPNIKKSITRIKKNNLRDYYLRRILLFASFFSIFALPLFLTTHFFMILLGTVFCPIRERHENSLV